MVKGVIACANVDQGFPRPCDQSLASLRLERAQADLDLSWPDAPLLPLSTSRSRGPCVCWARMVCLGLTLNPPGNSDGTTPSPKYAFTAAYR